MVNINTKEFGEFMEKELAFHRFRFYGTDEEKERNLKYLLKRYYDSLQHLRLNELEAAFKRCSEVKAGLPTIDEVIKASRPLLEAEEKSDIKISDEQREKNRQKVNDIINGLKGKRL